MNNSDIFGGEMRFFIFFGTKTENTCNLGNQTEIITPSSLFFFG